MLPNDQRNHWLYPEANVALEIRFDGGAETPQAKRHARVTRVDQLRPRADDFEAVTSTVRRKVHAQISTSRNLCGWVRQAWASC